MTLRLPYPPSVNHYWRYWRGRFVVAPAGRAYRCNTEAAVLAELGRPPRLACRLVVSLELVMPDRRRRDIDNALKCVLDSLQHAGVYLDDEQVDELHVRRQGARRPGSITVTVSPTTEVERCN